MQNKNTARAGAAQEQTRAYDPFNAWCRNNRPGDVFLEFFGPTAATRSIYGSPMTPEIMAPIVTMMAGVDVAVLQSAYEQFWVFSEHGLAIAMGVANG